MTAAVPFDRSRRPAPGPLRPYHFPAVQRRTLSNGLQLAVVEARSFPVVTVGLVLPSGALAEPEGKDGVASLTTALLESGAGSRNAAEIALVVDGLGLSMDSWASWDVSEASFTCLRARADEGMAVLADMVLRPTFPDDEVARLRAQRVTSLAQARGEAGGVAGEFAGLYVFGRESRYGRPMGGTAASVSGIGRDDVAAFHAAHYRPAGSTLFAAGDVSLDELAALAERHFGAWSGTPPPHAPPPPSPERAATRIVVADRPGAVQSAIRLSHPAPGRGTPDYFPMIVLNSVVGGNFSSRINMNLRERLGYTYGAHSAFGLRRTSGIFMVSTAVQTEVTAPSVAEILRDLREVREAEVTEAELADARTFLSGSFPLPMQTTDGLAAKLEALIVNGLPDDYFSSYRERVMEVTAADVLAAARAHLWPDRAVVIVAGDGARVGPQLEALGLGTVEVVDPASVLE
ncbi:MAG: peptidase domain protein [Gemmatimonadetes bacterium]|nr:peptidase domain protein [Gemmatimonadota bacterium]